MLNTPTEGFHLRVWGTFLLLLALLDLDPDLDLSRSQGVPGSLSGGRWEGCGGSARGSLATMVTVVWRDVGQVGPVVQPVARPTASVLLGTHVHKHAHRHSHTQKHTHTRIHMRLLGIHASHNTRIRDAEVGRFYIFYALHKKKEEDKHGQAQSGSQ